MKYQLLLAALAFAFVACGEENDYDEKTIEHNSKAKYDANFIAKYGDISNQTWDLTSGTQLVTRGPEDIEVIPVAGLNYGNPRVVTTGSGNNAKYTVQLDKNVAMSQSIFRALPDGTPHTGVRAVLVAPKSSFTIYPISSQTELRYDLCMKIGNSASYTIFSKTWTDSHVPYYNGMTTLDNHTVNMPGVMVKAPIGTPIELFLNIHDNNTTVSTSSGNALYIDVPDHASPEGINIMNNADIKFLGFEDNVNGGDRDYNDLVICVVGNPNVPVPETITNNSYTVETSNTKRYMIEDLGSVDDFDFNDIVMDVSENTAITHTITLDRGLISSDIISNTETSQKAIMRHLGGTLPFQLTIGNTAFKEMQGQMNVNPNTEFDITGWIPDQNNISIKVKEQSGVVYTITFPKKGTAPMIIAVDPTQKWMEERQSIPASWWTEE